MTLLFGRLESSAKWDVISQSWKICTTDMSQMTNNYHFRSDCYKSCHLACRESKGEEVTQILLWMNFIDTSCYITSSIDIPSGWSLSCRSRNNFEIWRGSKACPAVFRFLFWWMWIQDLWEREVIERLKLINSQWKWETIILSLEFWIHFWSLNSDFAQNLILRGNNQSNWTNNNKSSEQTVKVHL